MQAGSPASPPRIPSVDALRGAIVAHLALAHLIEIVMNWARYGWQPLKQRHDHWWLRYVSVRDDLRTPDE